MSKEHAAAASSGARIQSQIRNVGSAIHRVEQRTRTTRSEYFDRTVYDLTTDLTSPDAELIQGIGNGGASKGIFCVPLRLTVTQLK